jgi:hypothetical protein
MKRQPKTGIRGGFSRGRWLQRSLIVGLLLTLSFGFAQADRITIKGIPLPIALQAATDSQTMDAYLQGNKRGLHNRLQELEIEEKIKAFYRPTIRDEEKLDQYIHQLFYELTGYVGLAYEVNPQGTLVALYPAIDDQNYNRWVTLAQNVGVIVGTTVVDGVRYVIAPNGTKLPYSEAVELFPLPQLERLSQPP